MTTVNPQKKIEESITPLVNPILQEDFVTKNDVDFPKYKNSFEPELNLDSNKLGSKKIPKSRGWKMNLAGAILTLLANLILITLFVLLILKLFVFQQVEVDGNSMLPNFHDKDFLVMNMIDKNIERGRVVAIHSIDQFAYKIKYEMNPWDAYMSKFDCNPRKCNAKFYLKRAIGLPGEEIEATNGDIIIFNKENPNGAVLKEDYITNDMKQSMKVTNYHFARTKIPEGKYFVMGDNRTNSTDSRVLGPIADYAIFGKQVFRLGNFTKPNTCGASQESDSFMTSLNNSICNLQSPFRDYAWFDLPNYSFSAIPVDDKALMSK
jgi:signal peptidase I